MTDIKLPKIMLTKEQVFKLAKKYIDENNIDGFNKNFMFMTREMFSNLMLFYDETKKDLINQVEEMIDEQIDFLEKEHSPLKKEYDLLYQRWFTFGHRGEKLKQKLKSFEDGAEGNKMYSLQERVLELQDLKSKLKGLNENT